MICARQLVEFCVLRYIFEILQAQESSISKSFQGDFNFLWA